MNVKAVINVIGKALIIEAALLCFPLIVSFVYGEGITSYISFLIPIVGLLAVGFAFALIKPRDKAIYAREGFFIVAVVWIIMSLVGAVPYVIGGCIPNYIDAFFETVSGFTTTGASILSDVEVLPHSFAFWRLFAHWIGGMGVLVFILALFPKYNGGFMHVFRAESPGPTAGKLVSKIRFTASILYSIYLVLTALEVIFLLAGGMPVFDAFVHAFSTSGTGGFSIKNASIAAYGSVYIEMVIAVFMFLFGINFNVFYLMLIGNFSKMFKSEELRIYVTMVVLATIIIAVNILSMCADFWEALRYSFFQVTSVTSTTGFSTADFDTWPALSKTVLAFLSIVGACGGSTGGGVKVSRMAILFKSSFMNVKKIMRPRSVTSVRFEGQTLDEKTVSDTRTYFIVWFAVLIFITLLISIDGRCDMLSNFSATVACLGNIGPGFNMVGPTMNYGVYSYFSKIMLSFTMLVGRLEIFPMIVLFVPAIMRK